MILRYFSLPLLIFILGCKVSEPSFAHKSYEIKKIVSIVQEHHVLPKTIDDTLSIEMFRAYFNAVDKQKLIFTQNDIDKFRQFETKLDNELMDGKTDFLDHANALFQKRKRRAQKIAYHWIDSDFGSERNDIYTKDMTDFSVFSKHNKYLKEKWKVKIGRRYFDELKIVALEKPLLKPTLQAEIAKSKTKTYFEKYFFDLDHRTQQEIFDLYINAYIGLNDFQSKFFSVEAKKRWDKSFHRSYVGVGMYINVESGGYPVIESVYFDGPTWKTHKIHKGDLLLAIKKEDTYIDLAGLNLSSVLELLKGVEGSLVTVKIKNTEQKIEEVVIQRAKIKFDRLKAFVLEYDDFGNKIGYIKLPRFYAGEIGSASDVLDAIFELNEQKIDGLLFDLRNNKGGSSREVNTILGYFLKGGVSQYLQSKNGELQVFEDEDSNAQFEGKLIVMVNDKSASGSELFSGSIQDYGRGIIVGSQTFGKGTFQRFYDVTASDDSTSLGSIKLTNGSFYSADGHSNQLKGITPDIELPSEKMYIPTGERALEHALSFPDLVLEKDIQKEPISNIIELKKNSAERILANPFFKSIEEKAQNLAKKSPINLDINQKSKQINSELITVDGFDVKMLNKNNYGTESIKYWESQVKKDPYVYECLLIMNDFLNG